MRFFIALEIPDQNKAELERIEQQLKNILPEIRLTDTDKLHLTIAFMGSQPNELKPDLIRVMTEACQGVKSFEIAPGYIDGFPNLHHPRILWIGVKGDINELFVLRERVKDGLFKLQLNVDERRFIPHIAMGKLSNFRLTETQEDQLEQVSLADFQPIRITSIKLFESIPNQGFHHHNTLAEIKLEE